MVISILNGILVFRFSSCYSKWYSQQFPNSKIQLTFLNEELVTILYAINPLVIATCVTNSEYCYLLCSILCLLNSIFMNKLQSSLFLSTLILFLTTQNTLIKDMNILYYLLFLSFYQIYNKSIYLIYPCVVSPFLHILTSSELSQGIFNPVTYVMMDTFSSVRSFIYISTLFIQYIPLFYTYFFIKSPVSKMINILLFSFPLFSKYGMAYSIYIIILASSILKFYQSIYIHNNNNNIYIYRFI
ncbi:hypothetical protein WA158_000456 [Blastocystis sp. Blastoise]